MFVFLSSYLSLMEKEEEEEDEYEESEEEEEWGRGLQKQH